MTNKRVQKAIELYQEVTIKRRINQNTQRALGGNIPKHKKAKYLSALTEANLKHRIAVSNFNVAFEKLSNEDVAAFNLAKVGVNERSSAL